MHFSNSTLPAHRLDGWSYQGRRVSWSYYRTDDDLASAGLGVAGLAGAVAPSFENPTEPTLSELRRRAVYENYRALVDVTEAGGFGSFFGPIEPCPGLEIRAVLEDQTAVVVQLPEDFQPLQAKLLLIPASSSRGVYGGIVLSYWGLQRGYATVLCDKGCGVGFHNLSEDRVFTTEGRLTPGACADADWLSFRAPDRKEKLNAYRSRFPHRYATKHAHSGLNVESKWGDYVLQSLEFACQALKRLWPQYYQRHKTRVLATGLSNGGGASLRAAEQDSENRIDAVVVGEPNITPLHHPGFVIQQGDSQPLSDHSLSLLEYATLLNLYQPVASLAQETHPAFFDPAASRDRLQALQAQGLWPGLSERKAAAAARSKLLQAGLLKCQEDLAAIHGAHGVYESMSVGLVNCLGRYLVSDHLLGFSYAAIEPERKTPGPLSREEQVLLYARSNGLVPGGGLEVLQDLFSRLRGALDLYAVAWGADPVSGEAPQPDLAEIGRRVVRGLDQTKATAELAGRPAIIVNGRCDSIIAPNHASRSYLGRNLLVEGERSRLSYWELEHAQHLDSLNALAAFEDRFVPLVPYLYRALSLMDESLDDGQALPCSQVIRTKPRSRMEDGMVEPLQPKHMPDPVTAPQAKDVIVLRDRVLFIPQ